MTGTATLDKTATVTVGAFRWKTAFTPLSARVAELVRSDPAYGHRAAVDCAGMPGPDRPVRWAMTDYGMVVRAASAGPASTSCQELFDGPEVAATRLADGDRVTFSLLAVPERCVQTEDGWRRRDRGRRVPITDQGEVDSWLRDRLMGLDDVDIERFSLEALWSQELNHLWHAVRVRASATVKDPAAVSALMVGRSRAYGFGMPVFGPA